MIWRLVRRDLCSVLVDVGVGVEERLGIQLGTTFWSVWAWGSWSAQGLAWLGGAWRLGQDGALAHMGLGFLVGA